MSLHVQARLEAVEAAKAERRAAEAALNAVEGGIDFYAKNKNFDKLKEIAEASAVATKVLFTSWALVLFTLWALPLWQKRCREAGLLQLWNFE